MHSIIQNLEVEIYVV